MALENEDPDYVLQAELETEATETKETADKSLKEKAYITFTHIDNCLRENNLGPEEAARIMERLLQNFGNSISSSVDPNMNSISTKLEAVSKEKLDKTKLVEFKQEIANVEKALDPLNNETLIGMEQANTKALEILEANSAQLKNSEEYILNHIAEAATEATIDEIDTMAGKLKETDEQVKENNRNKAAMDVLDHHMGQSRIIKELRANIEAKNIFQSPLEVNKWKVETERLRTEIEDQQNNQKEIEKTVEVIQSKSTTQQHSPPENLKKLEDGLQVLTKALRLTELDAFRANLKIEDGSEASDDNPKTPQKRSRSPTKDDHTAKRRLDKIQDKQNDLLSFLKDRSEGVLETGFPRNIENVFQQYNEVLREPKESQDVSDTVFGIFTWLDGSILSTLGNLLL
ncbi:hypothetical protein CLU79DRAFT_716451 [Phycomyces nitens]|nr:hypothetical protein CLU79DRAFT_716451 [Phycomyces nitens]